MINDVLVESLITGSAADWEPDEAVVGGKAAGLHLLCRTGARVPAFFVVPAAVFRAQLRHRDVAGRVGELLLLLGELPAGLPAGPAVLGDASARLRAALEGAPLPEGLAGAVEAAAAGLGPGPYAVRSSMAGEDSAEHSFAGQLRSELFVPAAEVAASVRRCWSSAFGVPALVYAARAGLSPAGMRVAVVVQSMVDADVAGVAFSVNPVTGSREECVVSAALGVGEGVVAEAAPADSYAWSPLAGELSATVADKDVSVRASPSGRGTEVRAVPAADRQERALTREQVAQVGALARAVAGAAGRPVDLEWCFSRGVLYALQARPVTSLPPAAGGGERRVFDNSNIQESYNGVTTPLTFSFAARLYRGVYTSLLRTLGASQRTLNEFEPAGRTLLGLVDGRVYYNLGSWRHLIELLPRGRQRVREIEKVMFRTTIGVSERRKLPLPERLRRGAEVARVVARTVLLLARQDAEVDRYIERFERFYYSVDRAGLGSRTLDELGGLLRGLEREGVDPAARAYFNDVRLAIWSGRLRRVAARVHGEDQADACLAGLSGGIAGLESVEPVRLLAGIAADVRADAALAAAVRAAAPGEVVALIRQRSDDLAGRLDAWLGRYGDRTAGELKLETVSLRERPELLGEMIASYLAAPDIDPDGRQRGERARAEAALRALAERVPRWRRWLLAREVRAVRRAVSSRERLRLRRTWAFALARDIYRAIGGHLHEGGLLAGPRDIFYLSAEEIEDFLDGRAVSARPGLLVAARKAEYDGYRRRPAQDRLASTGTPYLGHRQELAIDDGGPVSGEQGDGLLRGLGCCAGIAEAPVRIITDPGGAAPVNGEILCTVRTDPGWAPLFPAAAGLLIERGSALSHSAVIARELGIPTVVGVPGVTRILQDGERVRLDGGTGVVERLRD